MLKKNEIEALSNKLNFDVRTTKHCLKDVYRDGSSVIDDEVICERDVTEFLKICAFAENRVERIKLFYSNICSRIIKKDPKKIIVYFIRDYFFCVMLAYLDKIDGKKFNKKFDHIELDNQNTFYYTMHGDNGEFMNYPIMNQRKSIITGNLLDEIIKTVEIDQDIFWIIAERDYVIKLCTEVAKEVGYQIFVVDYIRDLFVDYQEMAINIDLLNKTSQALQTYTKNKSIDYVLIYCLCESLRAKGYMAESIYPALAKLFDMKDSSIRRRYFEVKKKLPKNQDYKTLIKIYDLGRKIYDNTAKFESIYKNI